jgi:hypothetical protein
MNRVTLSPGAGGRGGSTASSSYDGGGGGGVLVDGTGPSIRRGTYNHESGEGYGAGGNYGYDGGVQECGTDGLIVVEVITGKVLCTSVFYLSILFSLLSKSATNIYDPVKHENIRFQLTVNGMIGKLENAQKRAEKVHEPNQEQRRRRKQMVGCVKGAQTRMKSVLQGIVQVSFIEN